MYVEMKNIFKQYGNFRASDNVNFGIEKGKLVALLGPSGSGKTTLLNCISTIDKVTSGNIYVDGNNITQLKGSALNRFRRDKLGFIFQDFNLLDTLTAYENIALALSIRNDSPEIIDRAVKNVAEQLDITEILNKYPYQMSGGQKQRVASARAIITSPSLVLADEPTTALDVIHRNGIIDLFSQMKANGVGILMVTHDFATALQLGGNMLVMKEGKIIESGEVQSVFDHTTEPYTRSLIEAYSLSYAFTKGAES